MRCKKVMKEVVLKVGMIAAKMDMNTTCLWINYQPTEPAFIIKMRLTKQKCRN